MTARRRETLDFLLQEMQREVNTVLSKTGNLEITSWDSAQGGDRKGARAGAECRVRWSVGAALIVVRAFRSGEIGADGSRSRSGSGPWVFVSFTTRAPRGTERNGRKITSSAAMTSRSSFGMASSWNGPRFTALYGTSGKQVDESWRTGRTFAGPRCPGCRASGGRGRKPSRCSSCLRPTGF